MTSVYVVTLDKSILGIFSSLDLASDRLVEYAKSQGCIIVWYDDGTFAMIPDDVAPDEHDVEPFELGGHIEESTLDPLL